MASATSGQMGVVCGKMASAACVLVATKVTIIALRTYPIVIQVYAAGLLVQRKGPAKQAVVLLCHGRGRTECSMLRRRSAVPIDAQGTAHASMGAM